jgi:hypothetical protein
MLGRLLCQRNADNPVSFSPGSNVLTDSLRGRTRIVSSPTRSESSSGRSKAGMEWDGVLRAENENDFPLDADARDLRCGRRPTRANATRKGRVSSPPTKFSTRTTVRNIPGSRSRASCRLPWRCTCRRQRCRPRTRRNDNARHGQRPRSGPCNQGMSDTPRIRIGGLADHLKNTPDSLRQRRLIVGEHRDVTHLAPRP